MLNNMLLVAVPSEGAATLSYVLPERLKNHADAFFGTPDGCSIPPFLRLAAGSSFLRRSKLTPRNPLKSLCGGSCGGVLRRFAAVAHNLLKSIVQRFCSSLRRGSPIPPIREAHPSDGAPP